MAHQLKEGLIMTTHYEKIQALGNRMASNLETMGVSASFSDGGLTLADKILQIQRFTNGLLLYADKNIIQIDDTVNLYALLLEDGKAISGETIKFDFGTIVSSKQVSLGDDLYDDYYVESSKTGSNYDSIGTGHSGFIQFNSSTIKTYVTSFSPEVTYNGEPFHIKNGVLTYKDTSDVERTIDVSAIDTSKAYAGAACTIHYHWIEATTGSDGVATVSYTGKGTGKLNIQAFANRRIISSGIFSLIDAIFYDDASTDQSSGYYINSVGGTSLSYSDGYYILSFGTSSTYVDLRSIVDDVKGKTVNFEVDVVLTGAEVRTRVYNGNTAIKSSEYTTTDGTILLENIEIPSDATNVPFRLERRNTSTASSIKFKNWRVYSV